MPLPRPTITTTTITTTPLQPVALVGTAEKGFETWTIEVRGEGGHSSMPPIDGTSVAARVARVLSALDASPAPTRLGPPTTDWLRALAPSVALAPLRAAMQNADNWVSEECCGSGAVRCIPGGWVWDRKDGGQCGAGAGGSWGFVLSCPAPRLAARALPAALALVTCYF